MSARTQVGAAEAVKPAAVRCAIYTRKSSDEGLEQSFNSLDAQREACEAYVRSQTHEGWVVIPTLYDDGGFSGGSMERPALKALLKDIASGRIDVVCVYKIDRLTRSLGDFGRIVEVFDRAGASFVSVTQAFNTTTSMGRLTLNVLLSFAQFEREVTGERIRDKIAQSKAKGMWMGGVKPLGYDSKDQVLVVNEEEAKVVRFIFERYLKLRSAHALCRELDKTGIRSKRWATAKGRSMGGRPITRGALYHLLQNRHYIGETVHKDKSHKGLHPAIIERATFEKVQALLAKNRNSDGSRKGSNDGDGAWLKGRLFDPRGDRMSPTRSRSQRGKSFNYYVSTSLQSGQDTKAALAAGARRLPALKLEAFALGVIRRLTGRLALSWLEASPLLLRLEIKPERVDLVFDLLAIAGLDHPDLVRSEVLGRLGPGEQLVDEARATNQAESGGVIRVSLPGGLRFRGGASGRQSNDTDAPPHVDPELVRALLAARKVADEVGIDPLNPRAGGGDRSPDDAYHRMLCRLAFLAPDLQLAILEGRHPPGISVRRLIDVQLPLSWDGQRHWWRSQP